MAVPFADAGIRQLERAGARTNTTARAMGRQPETATRHRHHLRAGTGVTSRGWRQGAGPRTTQRGMLRGRGVRAAASPGEQGLSSTCQAAAATSRSPWKLSVWGSSPLTAGGSAAAELPGQPGSGTHGMSTGAGAGPGLHLESRTQAAGQLCSALPAAGMSHLVGSHLQSVLLKQFHSLGGWKTGHQLRGSEERALSPQTSPEQGGAGLAGGGRRGAKSLRPRGCSSPVLQAQPGGPRQPLCTLALRLLGQSRGWGCPLTSMAA